MPFLHTQNVQSSTLSNVLKQICVYEHFVLQKRCVISHFNHNYKEQFKKFSLSFMELSSVLWHRKWLLRCLDCSKCLLEPICEGKIEGTTKRGRRCKQILDNLGQEKILELVTFPGELALRGYGPVVKESTQWMTRVGPLKWRHLVVFKVVIFPTGTAEIMSHAQICNNAETANVSF